MARRFDPDVVPGLALAALGGYVTWKALGWELLTEDGPGPGFFPLGYGVLFVVLSGLLVARALLRPRTQGGAGDPRGNLRALLTWAAFAAAAFTMQWIGFVAGFAALSAIVVVFVFGRSWARGAAVGLASATGFWLLFHQVMGVGLPAGPWGF